MKSRRTKNDIYKTKEGITKNIYDDLRDSHVT